MRTPEKSFETETRRILNIERMLRVTSPVRQHPACDGFVREQPSGQRENCASCFILRPGALASSRCSVLADTFFALGRPLERFNEKTRDC
jgi:hypothetical protein